MLYDIFGSCKDFFYELIEMIDGPSRRRILAKVSIRIGKGGKSLVAREFNVGRDTIRKGIKEVLENKPIEDANSKKGRKSTLEKLSNLENHIKEIGESQSQIDPKFQSERLYTRLTVEEFRRELINKKGYSDIELPTNQTLNNIINKLGFKLTSIQKTKPLKKIKETDTIFKNLSKLHETIKETDKVLRLSIDAKDRVKIGEFSRGGKSRIGIKALDHDFGDKYITPFGIMNMNNDTIDISMIESKLTSDCIADVLENYWYKNEFSKEIDVLLLNIDNGQEGSSSRTQFIKRIVEFSAKINKKIILAYYPPYHSKYNPIERYWGRLEKHWNGDLLCSKEVVVKLAESATWKGINPVVSVVNKVYKTGIKVKNAAIKIYESALERKKGIEKWFVVIKPEKSKRAVLEVNNL